MAGYKVVVVNEDRKPIQQIVVEAIDLANYPTVSATATTDEAGQAIFSGLDGPHFFRPRVRRTSATVGDRIFTGQVEVQVVATDGGSLLCYDYIVSECWADEVAAGRGVEGQTIALATGCTTKIYSTVQGAWDAIETAFAGGGGTANVFICPGSYGAWTIAGAAIAGSRVTVHGAGAANVTIASISMSGAAGFSDTGGGEIHNLRVTGTTTIDAVSASIAFRDCVLNNLATTSGQTGSDVLFDHCNILGSLSGAGQCATWIFRDCGIAGSLVTTGYTGPFYVFDCNIAGGIDLGGSVSACTAIIIAGGVISGKINGNANAIRINDGEGFIGAGLLITSSGMSGPTILLANTGGRLWNINIHGVIFYSGNSNGYLGTGSGEVRRANFSGCTFPTNGGATVKAVGATAHFAYTTFGPNAPDLMDYSPVTTTSGGNVYWTQTGTLPSGASRGFALDSEPYVTIGNTAGLSAERALTEGTDIDITDGGANGAVTVAHASPGSPATGHVMMAQVWALS